MVRHRTSELVEAREKKLLWHPAGRSHPCSGNPTNLCQPSERSISSAGLSRPHKCERHESTNRLIRRRSAGMCPLASLPRDDLFRLRRTTASRRSRLLIQFDGYNGRAHVCAEPSFDVLYPPKQTLCPGEAADGGQGLWVSSCVTPNASDRFAKAFRQLIDRK